MFLFPMLIWSWNHSGKNYLFSFFLFSVLFLFGYLLHRLWIFKYRLINTIILTIIDKKLYMVLTFWIIKNILWFFFILWWFLLSITDFFQFGFKSLFLFGKSHLFRFRWWAIITSWWSSIEHIIKLIISISAAPMILAAPIIIKIIFVVVIFLLHSFPICYW